MIHSFRRDGSWQRLWTPIRLLLQEIYIWAASSEFGIYHLCEQRRFRRACASVQSRQNLRCSFIQPVSQEEPSNRKPDPWPLWMAEHTQLKFVKTQIRLTCHIIPSSPFGHILWWNHMSRLMTQNQQNDPKNDAVYSPPPPPPQKKNEEAFYMVLYIGGTKVRKNSKHTSNFKMQWMGTLSNFWGVWIYSIFMYYL